MTTKDILDKDGVRLPIKIDSTSNGEHVSDRHVNVRHQV